MLLLALETSGMSGSVALLESDAFPHVVSLAAGQRSARALAPAIRQALADVGRQPRDVRVVAVTAGPGSFTGLRIGVTTAKTLAYALGADLIAVDTLDVLARQAGPGDGGVGRLHAVIDAHRSELFASTYRNADGTWTRDEPTHLTSVDAWIETLKSGDRVTGPVVAGLAERFPAGVLLVDSPRCVPSAVAVAELAAEAYAAGRRDDLWTLSPWYGRLAAAEEKRLANEGEKP